MRTCVVLGLNQSYLADTNQPAGQVQPVVQRNGSFYELVADHHGTWSSGLTITAGETVEYNGKIYEAVAANTANPADDIVLNGAGANWNDLGSFCRSSPGVYVNR